MFQLALFDEILVEDMRKKVMEELTRIEGEDWDDYLEVVRYEVDYRLKELRKQQHKPCYRTTQLQK